jgi:hypothetical protein
MTGNLHEDQYTFLITFCSFHLGMKNATDKLCREIQNTHFMFRNFCFNSLSPELNPICYLLALLEAHHFLHVSRIRVKSLNLRLLMSYIYIYGRVITSSQRPLPDNTSHSQQTNIHAPGGIQTHDLIRRAAADLRHRPRGQWDRHKGVIDPQNEGRTIPRKPVNVYRSSSRNIPQHFTLH